MPVESLLFTQRALQEIEIPENGREVYKDTKEKGLMLIVSYGGSKTFYLGKNIGMAYHRIKIGRFPDLSVADARIAAVKLKGDIARGINPVEEKAKNTAKGLTFAELLDKYINDYAKHNMKWWQYYQNTVRYHAEDFYPMRISTISKTNIQDKFNEISKKSGIYAANRFLDILRSMLNKAVEWELLETNPAIYIKKHKEEFRTRHLTKEELPRFFQALKDENNQLIEDFFLIALFT